MPLTYYVYQLLNGILFERGMDFSTTVKKDLTFVAKALTESLMKIILCFMLPCHSKRGAKLMFKAPLLTKKVFMRNYNNFKVQNTSSG